MRPHFLLLSLPAAALVTLALLPSPASIDSSSGSAHAAPAPRSSGVFGYSGNPAHNGGAICSQCHTGGSAPQVTLEGPTLVQAGSTARYTFRVSGGQRLGAGLGVSVSDGVLQGIGNTRVDSDGDELTQLSPEPVDGLGRAEFDFDWIAPASAGTVTMWAAGNSVDLGRSTGGDNAMATVQQVEVVDCLLQVEPFGTGTPGTGFMRPRLDGTPGPCSGGGTLDLTMGRGGALALLWVSDQSASLSFAGGTLYVDPFSAVFFDPRFVLSGASGAPGAGELHLNFPDLDFLAPGELFVQALVVDPQAFQGVALSNGARIALGL